jgi:tetratricopeptide (TPR) repeat protein/DNA-binding CsgD family transcriptional regulator
MMNSVVADLYTHLKRKNSFLLLLTAFMYAVPLHAQVSFARSGSNSSIITIPAAAHPDSVFIDLKEQLHYHRQNRNLVGEASCLTEMGNILYRIGNYSQSIEYLLKADRIFRASERHDLLAGNLNLLGTVYYYNQQMNKARPQFDEALAIFRKTKNANGIAETYGLIGRMFEKQLQYDSAFRYQVTALNIAVRSEDRSLLAKIYENIGSIYEDRGAFDSAQHYYQRSLGAYETLGRLIEQIEVINNLGDVFSKTGDYEKGLMYAQQAASLALANGEKYQLQSAFRDMAQCFAAMRRYDSAYAYLDKSRQLIQSIYTIQSSYQTSLQQTIYDTEKKDETIRRLDSERRITALLYTAAIAVLILLALTGALIINRQKLKINGERALNKSNQKIYETEKGLMESELKRQQMEETALKQQLEVKSRELSSHILHLIQKNEVMEEVKKGLTEISKDDKRDHKKQVRQLLHRINTSFSQDAYWDEFRITFEKVHPDFLERLRHRNDTLTPSETKLLSLLKMNLNSTDIATLLGIAQDSLRVMRYRVKKKLGLGAEQSLTSFIHQI